MSFIRSKFLLIALFLFSSLAFLSSSFAEEQRPCKADFEKFCSNVPKGEGRRIKCFKEHETELSPACQAKMKNMQDKLESFKNDCQPDIQKFCSNVPSKHWEKMKCLKEHSSEISSACQNHLNWKNKK